MTPPPLNMHVQSDSFSWVKQRSSNQTPQTLLISWENKGFNGLNFVLNNPCLPQQYTWQDNQAVPIHTELLACSNRIRWTCQHVYSWPYTHAM